MSAYDNERVDDYKTFGDAMRMRRRSEAAFVAGVQYALDRLLNRTEGCASSRLLDAAATAILVDAKAGDL